MPVCLESYFVICPPTLPQDIAFAVRKLLSVCNSFTMLGELKTKAQNCHELNTEILKMERNIWFPIRCLHKHAVCCHCLRLWHYTPGFVLM